MANQTSRVLVTGGAGFIGPMVVKKLLKMGFSVVVFDKLTYAARTDTAGKSLTLQMVLDGLSKEEQGRFEFVRGDVTEPISVKHALEKYQINNVIHMAAESHVDRSTEGRPEFINTEIFGTYNVLEAVRAQNMKEKK